MAGGVFADGWTWLVVSEETAHKKSATYVRKHKWRIGSETTGSTI